MIVLSGASGGIGKEMIPMLLKDHAVIGLYHAHRPEFPASERLMLDAVDLASASDVSAFAKRREASFERVTLVHGAVQSIDGLAAQYAEEDWDRVMDVNLKGNFLLTKALLPIMMQQRWGRIIHLSSVAGVEGVPGVLAYAASKTGLLGISRVLAKEYARYDVTSNVLKLGYFETGLIHQLTPPHREKILNAIPNKKLGKVEEIVRAVNFLIQSDYVNGSVISIDGGM